MNSPWISITDKLPLDKQKVTIGHCHGKWIEWDVLFIAKDNSFRLRVNANLGGDAGYKQKDTKKPNGDKAGPDEWLLGAQAFPTHWMPLPETPK